MKIALITDLLTNDALLVENHLSVKQLTPLNYKIVLKLWKPDLLFVESAWQGHKNKWKYKIAAYPKNPKRNNHKLEKVVNYAKSLGIPTVFWNKEDAVHFDRFIESAKLFEHIFTVDENCISKYREVVSEDVTVNILMFAVQSKFHYFSGFDFKYNRVNFVGSYSQHIHEKRRFWQDIVFTSVVKSGLGLDIYDRNSNRKMKYYRYPKLDNIKIFSAVSYEKTAQIYKDHTLSLNVNTIENSKTMFSRRLIEIMACGSVAVTNPSLSVDTLFKKYCYVVSSEKEMDALFERIAKYGLSDEDKVMAKAASEYVARKYTWTHRLREIKQIVGI